MKTLLFHSPTIDPVLLANLKERFPFDAEGVIEQKLFHDTTLDARICNVGTLRNQRAVYLANMLHSDPLHEWMKLRQLARSGLRELIVVLGFFPYATMSKEDKPGTVVSAKHFADLLSSIQTDSCQVEFVIYDIHELQVLRYFDEDRVRVTPRSMMPRMRRYIETEVRDPIYIAPDAGAYTRFRQYFDLARCSKVRDGEHRVVTAIDKIQKGRNLVIVDDLASSCTTLNETAIMLQTNFEPKSISAIVTHGVFPRESWCTLSAGLYHLFITSDTLPTSNIERVPQLPFFMVLSIASDLAELLDS